MTTGKGENIGIRRKRSSSREKKVKVVYAHTLIRPWNFVYLYLINE